MADSRDYITHYAKYFKLRAPSVQVQSLIILLLGAAVGCLASAIIHLQHLSTSFVQIIISGLSAGILVVSLPALLTVVIIKIVKRKMLLKHAMLSTLPITGAYAILLFIGSASFALTKNPIISYFFLLLVNAGIYGYWLIVGKFIMGRVRNTIPVAAAQPLLNILFYLPLGGYILSFAVPLNITLVKLFAGMFVFLSADYVLIYLIDRPSKKILEVSGMNVLISMIGQWLFNLTSDVSVIGKGVGTKRELTADILALRSASGYKAIFINPDIHFGPFQGAGGSVAPLLMGRLVAEKFGAAPFIIHSPLDIQDNPISASQVYSLGSQIEQGIRKVGGFEKAYGSFSLGADGDCRSLNVSVGDAALLFLTKAPEVTEDISREVGLHFRQFAESLSGRNEIVIDAHNSRFESANEKELAGIQAGNPYIRNYERAIRDSSRKGAEKRLHFGASYKRISRMLKDPKDLGEGYTSVCVFQFNGRKLCIVYFDANNMLPGFREKLLSHIKSRFNLNAEVCTTDTHSLNTLAYSASDSLGRFTNVNSVIPIIDGMIKNCLANLEPVSYAYRKLKVKDFSVWGEKADLLIERTSREVRRMLKYFAPLFVVFALILAAWAIYVI
jgi:predicted neutral ceramidase superfamily lipid hydrolase